MKTPASAGMAVPDSQPRLAGITADARVLTWADHAVALMDGQGRPPLTLPARALRGRVRAIHGAKQARRRRMTHGLRGLRGGRR